MADGNIDARSTTAPKSAPVCGLRGLLVLSVGLVLCGSNSGCGSDQASRPDGDAPSGKPVVFAVNYPLAFFARQVGGDAVEVVLPVPADADPATWPASEDVATRAQQADVILDQFGSYAKWTELWTLPRDKRVDTTRDFRADYVRVEDFSVHSHGPEGQHSHPGTGPNVWLDPKLAVHQVRAVAEALSRLRGVDADTASARGRELVDRLREYDRRLTEHIGDQPERPLFASHPFCTYLARRANWKLRHVHWKPDELPDEGQWKRLEERLAEHPAKWMLWEEEPAPRIVERLESLGVKSVVLPSGANTPEAGDLFDVYDVILERIEPILEGSAASETSLSGKS